MFFTRQEYTERWEKVSRAMAKSGYETLLVWQRSSGTYDRVGDVYWLTNYKSFGTGQEPASDAGAPYTFAAVLLRRDREPELHTGLSMRDIEPSTIVCGEIFNHDNLMLGLSKYLRAQNIEGRIAVVGDDILPGMYDRVLRQHTPQIEWVSEETFLLGPQSIKSPRELEAYRIAGDISTRSLSAMMEALIAGETRAEAASRAAAIILRAGGGFHRLDISHGQRADRVLNDTFYGYDLSAPSYGEFVRGWVYGPLFEGYWLDPGRTAICGNKPTAAQRSLVESAADIVNSLVAAVRPGVTARDLGVLGTAMARKSGYFDNAQLNIPHLGHRLGTFFVFNLIPLGDDALVPDEANKLLEPLQPGMVVTSEIFLSHDGVGTAGFEQNYIVTDTGTELLTRTPMLFW